jgi:PPOX class probable F420-dependent enzyme
MRASSTLTREQRRFLAAARSATLATLTPKGRPRLVPICFVVGADDASGRPRLFSPLDEKPKRIDDPRALARVRDILVQPDISLLVDRWSEDWSRLGWLRLLGRGDVLEPPGEPAMKTSDREEHVVAVGALRHKYPQYATHDLESRPIIRLTIDRAVSWGDLSTNTPSEEPSAYGPR